MLPWPTLAARSAPSPGLGTDRSGPAAAQCRHQSMEPLKQHSVSVTKLCFTACQNKSKNNIIYCMSKHDKKATLFTACQNSSQNYTSLRIITCHKTTLHCMPKNVTKLHFIACQSNKQGIMCSAITSRSDSRHHLKCFMWSPLWKRYWFHRSYYHHNWVQHHKNKPS